MTQSEKRKERKKEKEEEGQILALNKVSPSLLLRGPSVEKDLVHTLYTVYV